MAELLIVGCNSFGLAHTTNALVFWLDIVRKNKIHTVHNVVNLFEMVLEVYLH